MKKKIFGGIAVLAFISIAVINISLTKQENLRVVLSLSSIEQKADATEVNYSVPDKSNKPEECTLELAVGGSGTVGSEGVQVGGTYKKVAGMKNFCGKGKSGCDPYNCHQRV